MNNQTPGPLRAIDGTPCQGCDSFLMVENGGALGHSPKPSESALGYTRYKKADASLLAAAYSSFDRAGRALGIDATALAQSLDITALLISLERLEVGRASASSTACEWYEGIENDAANELTSLLHRLPMSQIGT